jgi:hypothetical protein
LEFIRVMSALCQKQTSMHEVFDHALVHDAGFASTEKP